MMIEEKHEPAKIVYRLGLPEQYKAAAVDLYDDAFAQKFKLAVHSPRKRKALLASCFMLGYGIFALANGRLVGLAGFQTPQGSLTGGITEKMLTSQLGVLKGYYAAFVFSCYERKSAAGELLMDGIAVHGDYRGCGIGGGLLDEIGAYARAHGYQSVRLDVIDTNPKAKRLYERQGFVTEKTDRFPYLRWFFGFGASVTMRLKV